MNYTFTTNIQKNEYNQFIKQCSGVSFMQEYNWPKIKKDWQHLHCALYVDNQIQAACVVLIRSLPLGRKLFYVPKGYVIDFTNQKLVSIFTKEIVMLARKKKAYVVRVDPNFCVKETSIQEKLDDNKIGIPIFSNQDYIMKHKNMIDAGFTLKERKKSLDSTNQPRFNMAIPLVNNNYEPLDEIQIKSSFRKKIRRYFGNFHQQRGIFYECTKDTKHLDTFMNMINHTENRQHINLRNKEYFRNIMENFDAYLFFGKLHVETYVNFLTTTNKDKELKQIQLYLDKDEKIITLSSSLVIIPKNKTGIRTSEYLYTGNNLDFSKLYVSYGLVYQICMFSMKQGCHFLNLGGVDGNLDDHLSMFKARFNPIVWEFSGEYNYILRPIYYHAMEKLLPTMKRYYRLIKHRH